MVTNLDELKKLIFWCKNQKIKKLKIKDIEFEISELDFIQDEPKSIQPDNKSNMGEYNSDTLIDTMEESSDWRNDPDLFHSTNS